MNRKITPCQPGFGSSCSLCCGSHNFKLSPQELDELFEQRYINLINNPLKSPLENSEPKLFNDHLQCPNIGLNVTTMNGISCMVYHNYSENKDLHRYFNRVCKKFYCAAWDDLTDEQLIFAAELMKDWYYYSLFINDIESVHEFYASYINASNVPEDELETLKEDLVQRYIDEDGK